MTRAESPIKVVFETLKSMHVAKGSLAALLLRDDRATDGVIPRDRASNPYAISRLLAADPDDAFPPEYYRDFAASAQALCSRLTAREWTPDAIVDRLADEPSSRMCKALERFGRDGRLYLATFERARAMQGLAGIDRASLALLVFVATGCLADPYQAGVSADRLAKAMGASGLRTAMPSSAEGVRGDGEEPASPADAAPRLGIVRVTDGALDLAELHELSCADGGTLIGTMAPSGPADAFNVPDPQVSRRHLRIWRASDGRWYAQGLGSTNGTTLISGSDKSEQVVEPPKRERQRHARPEPMEVRAGDCLVLAGRAVFLLLPIR